MNETITIEYTCKSCRWSKRFGIDDELPLVCPECESKSCTIRFIKRKQVPGKFVNISYGEHERWSRSMGCPPADIAEYQKKYPGSEYNSNGDLRIKNYTHRNYEMKRRNMVDLGDRK